MNFHRNHWLLFGTIFFGFIGLAVIIAIAPAYWVQIDARMSADGRTLTPLQQRGLEVYIAEGCVACHTQQVRPLPMDEMWGRPSAPQDYNKLGGPMGPWRPYTPAVLGSSRIGPDLSDVGSRQPSEAWHYLHLYNPRAVVADSVMPAYPWLFDVVASPDEEATVVSIPAPYAPDKGQVVPNERGEALVAYLLSLRQPRHSQAPGASGADGEGASGARESGDEQPGRADTGSASPAGATVYANNCASCHQDNGQGLPGTFPPLAGDPVVTADDPARHIDIVLHGAQGSTIDGTTYSSPMPGFANQLSDEEIAAVINHERGSWGNDAPRIGAGDVAERRNAEPSDAAP